MVLRSSTIYVRIPILTHVFTGLAHLNIPFLQVLQAENIRRTGRSPIARLNTSQMPGSTREQGDFCGCYQLHWGVGWHQL